MATKGTVRPRLRVLAKAKYRRFQGNHANCAGVAFQVTECDYRGLRFFVRENFRYDTFTSNSGVRWGLQQGHSVSGVNVLELACEPEFFDELSCLVHEADALKRPVVRNRRFTLRTAPRYFKRSSDKIASNESFASHENQTEVGNHNHL